MHFSHAILLFTGSAAAIPVLNNIAAIDARTPNSVASALNTNPVLERAAVAAVQPGPFPTVKPAGATSTSVAVAQSPTLTASSSCNFCNDLTNLDKATKNLISAVDAFVGGPNIQAQGDAMTSAGGTWQNSAASLLRYIQLGSVKGGTLSTDDSASVANFVSDATVPGIVTLYETIAKRKPMFSQVGEVKRMRDVLIATGNELTQIATSLRNRLQSQDLPKLEKAGNKASAAFQLVLAAYS